MNTSLGFFNKIPTCLAVTFAMILVALNLDSTIMYNINNSGIVILLPNKLQGAIKMNIIEEWNKSVYPYL